MQVLDAFTNLHNFRDQDFLQALRLVFILFTWLLSSGHLASKMFILFHVIIITSRSFIKGFYNFRLVSSLRHTSLLDPYWGCFRTQMNYGRKICHDSVNKGTLNSRDLFSLNECVCVS